MMMPGLQFLYEANLISRGNTVCVDGAFDAALQLSHWPGNTTPPELKADTSAEIAFNLITHPNAAGYLNGISVVSNNHFDADGLIAAFILLFPEPAIALRRQLQYVARTGDFNEFTNEDALKTASIIEQFGRQFNAPGADMQQLYLEALRLLPEFVTKPDAFEPYWKDDFAWYQQGDASFARQESLFSNYADLQLSVLETRAPLHAVVMAKYAAHGRVLVAQKTTNGTCFSISYAVKTWFDLGKPQPVKRLPLEPLAEKLNLMETAPAVSWQIAGANPMYDFDYKAYSAAAGGEPAPSSLELYKVEDAVADFIITVTN